MKPSDIIRSIMKTIGLGTNSLAERMGKPPRLVSDRLSQDNISVDKLNEMLRVMGYKLMIIPRDVRCADGWYVVDNAEQPQKKKEEETTAPVRTSRGKWKIPAEQEKSIEEKLKDGEITFQQAIQQGWVPTQEMLDKMLNT